MIEVTRSDFTESTHHGVAVLINSNGEVLKEWGNSNILIYPRSALKPIQTLNLYKDGVAEALNLSNDFIFCMSFKLIFYIPRPSRPARKMLFF